MNRDEFKRESDSVTDKVLLWVVNLPAPWSFVVLVAWTAGHVVLGAFIG